MRNLQRLATISDMSALVSNQRGDSSLVVPLAVTAVLLAAALGFGGWSFAQMLDYKNNADQKIAQATATAKQQEDKLKDTAFAEAEKQPLKAYNGPEAYGSLVVNYPKTWSAYIIDTHSSSPYVDGYFAPNVVPDVQAPNSVFSLRIQIEQQPYSSELAAYNSLVQQGKTKVTPFSAPKVPGVVGSRIDGQLAGGKSGTMVILPLRNTTLKLWIEAPQYENDFNANILPNFSFLP